MPLSGLTDQNFDPPGIQILRARQVLDEMPISLFDDSVIDMDWN